MKRFFKFKTLRDERGFTFVEAILTMTVFTLGMMGALAISQNIVETGVENDYRVMAGQLASEKMEMVIADKAFNGYTYLLNSNYPSETFPTDFKNFTRTVSIEEVSTANMQTPTPGSGLKKVEVTVNWGSDPSQSVTVTTVVAEQS